MVRSKTGAPVGDMLQQRIAAERARADADGPGGSLTEQLARALDYRIGIAFACERQQDGQWRKPVRPGLQRRARARA